MDKDRRGLDAQRRQGLDIVLELIPAGEPRLVLREREESARVITAVEGHYRIFYSLA